MPPVSSALVLWHGVLFCFRLLYYGLLCYHRSVRSVLWLLGYTQSSVSVGLSVLNIHHRAACYCKGLNLMARVLPSRSLLPPVGPSSLCISQFQGQLPGKVLQICPAQPLKGKLESLQSHQHSISTILLLK